jgi:hypothetical protein
VRSRPTSVETPGVRVAVGVVDHRGHGDLVATELLLDGQDGPVRGIDA